MSITCRSAAEIEKLARVNALVARVLPETAHGVRVAGDPDQRVEHVGLCGGAGDFLLDRARAEGVDVYLTSDLRQLSRVARGLGPLVPGLDVKALIAEVQARAVEELDYQLEAEAQRAFAEEFRDDPEIVVAVTLQRPIKGYFGGVVAGPVFKDVMTYALQELQIPPTGTKSPTVKVKADQTPDPSDATVLRDRGADAARSRP